MEVLMDQTTKEKRLDEWHKLICEAEASGISKAEWCRANGVSQKQYYYWRRKVRMAAEAENIAARKPVSPAVTDEPAFLELLPPAKPDPSQCAGAEQAAVALRFHGYELLVSSPAAEQTLEMVMKVLRDA